MGPGTANCHFAECAGTPFRACCTRMTSRQIPAWTRTSFHPYPSLSGSLRRNIADAAGFCLENSVRSNQDCGFPAFCLPSRSPANHIAESGACLPLRASSYAGRYAIARTLGTPGGTRALKPLGHLPSPRDGPKLATASHWPPERIHCWNPARWAARLYPALLRSHRSRLRVAIFGLRLERIRSNT
jgi:hypothetical protein